jgi:hypothetical protein
VQNPFKIDRAQALSGECVAAICRHVGSECGEKATEKQTPILATALALASPVWTEDADFFGTGVAVWTTNRIELFLETEDRSLRPGQEE